MGRAANTTRSGDRFDEATVEAVWRKAVPVLGYPTVRKDACGAFIGRSLYGNRSSPNGWEIDHIKPVAAGGPDALSNLQPLQWENNVYKGDDWPHWTCKVKS